MLCSNCYIDEAQPERSDQLCRACGDWLDYWSQLTPAQKRKEDDAMARYAAADE